MLLFHPMDHVAAAYQFIKFRISNAHAAPTKQTSLQTRANSREQATERQERKSAAEKSEYKSIMNDILDYYICAALTEVCDALWSTSTAPNVCCVIYN